MFYDPSKIRLWDISWAIYKKLQAFTGENQTLTIQFPVDWKTNTQCSLSVCVWAGYSGVLSLWVSVWLFRSGLTRNGLVSATLNRCCTGEGKSMQEVGLCESPEAAETGHAQSFERKGNTMRERREKDHIFKNILFYFKNPINKVLGFHTYFILVISLSSYISLCPPTPLYPLGPNILLTSLFFTISLP